METVVLNSDIARLVLDYLKSQNLKRATHIFCKTSPYLKEEFNAYKLGLQTHSFFPEFKEIICEYVTISRKVEKLLPKLGNILRIPCQQRKLSDKVSDIIDRAMQIILSHHGDESSSSSHAPEDITVRDNISTVPQTGNSINSDKENNNNIKVSETNRKRERSASGNITSNDEESADANVKGFAACARLKQLKKKRRKLEPYCFLNTKALQRHKHQHNLHSSRSTSGVQEGENEEEDKDSTNSSNEEVNVETDEEDAEEEYEEGNDDAFDDGRPTKESTPRSKSLKADSRIAPEISQAILENPEFQQRLVDNINQALNESPHRPLNDATTPSDPTPTKTNTNQNIGDTSMVSSSQILNQMIKNIMEATEKDPTFDDIIQEVVELSNKPLVQSTAIQCEITPSTVVNTIQEGLPSGSYTVAERTNIVQSRPFLLPAQIQQHQEQVLQLTSTINTSSVNTTNAPLPPRTPLIIRTALAATDATAMSTSSPAQDLNIDTNNSFGSLIDPNFSISKLILLNQSESARKQHPDATFGSTAAENIISQLSTSQLTAGELLSADEQVYFDTVSGQIAFPIVFTNDGFLANIPFLVNNDVMAQPLQSNTLGNQDTSSKDIPLAEPMKIALDQLPPNSIILGSSLKSNDPQVSQQTLEKASNVEERNKGVCATAPPATLENKMGTDKATPSASGIVNSKAYKSLSTPRKRTSHVRTLTFSPQVGTPLSTRRDAVCSRFQETLPKTNSSSTKQNLEVVKKNPEMPIIKNVLILPKLPVSNDTLKDESSTLANESASSGNVPPLFVTEENSNQTVINKHIPVTKDSPKIIFESTPKKPPTRKNSARSCKRQITKSQVDQDPAEKKVEKESEKKIPSPGTQEYKDYMMEQWNQQRSCSGPHFDIHLRELNAKMTNQKPAKKVPKKRVRRKKLPATKRKEIELAEEAEELEKSKVEELEQEFQSLDDDVTNQNIVAESEIKCEMNKEGNNDDYAKLQDDICKNISNVKEQNRHDNLKKSKDFFLRMARIDTVNENVLIKEKLKECAQDGKGKDNGGKQFDNFQTEIAEIAPVSKEEKPNLPAIKISEAEPPHHHNESIPLPQPNKDLEREKRTSNMAFLLETPLKSMDMLTCIPPTPGAFASALETPIGKKIVSHDDMQVSSLFGSLTKSELDTPMLNAITPGARFTPFGTKEAATPRSGAFTETSSGAGSYYKPDENEDLDRNIDKILRDSAQKKQEQNKTEETNKANAYSDLEDGELQSDAEEADEIECEIAMKTLKVEPIVLKRIKSFGSEDVESVEGVKIEPHYTLAAGLPEIKTAGDEDSSSSSSSSCSSSSSPSSSSNSSSSSSSSSSASNLTAKSKNEEEIKPPETLKSELEQLSEISSTEDEDWMRQAASHNIENSQLVNNDGEVRYPVRSWLTPIKENIFIEPSTLALPAPSPTQSAIKMTLPDKSQVKINPQVKELELKRERLKEKLKNDASNIGKKDKPISSTATAPNISQALATTRVLHAMRDKGKKPTCFENMQGSNTSETANDKRSIDVLTALNLSAKKQLSKTPEADTSKAKSNLFNSPLSTNQNANAAKMSGKEENLKLANLTASSKTAIRKCLPIEARPATKTIRKPTKKIVRTPLAFKSMDEVNTKTPAKLTMKPTELATSPLVQTQAVRVSPRLMKPKKTRAKKTEDFPTNKTKTNARSAKEKSSPTKKENTKKPSKAKGSKTENEPMEKKPLDDEKRGAEELKSQNTASSLCHIKPKIHLKAGKKMVSNKNKSCKPEEQVQLQTVTGAEVKTDLSKDKHPVNEILTTRSEAITSTIVIADNSVEDTSDDDPMEHCEMTTFDESDAKRFVHCIYEGTDQPTQMIANNPDLANFQMLVAIDENEKHVWTISEGICLYSCAPAPIRTIPRKRKIQVTSSLSNDKQNAPTSAPVVTNVTTKIAPVSLKAFTTAANPGATSTPVQQQSRTERPNPKQGTQKHSKTKVPPKASLERSTNLPADNIKSEEKKIQIEDIESILSHLHGT